MEVASSSAMPSKPTERSNQSPHIGGAGIAFETSELTDEDIEALKQQGLSPVEQNDEGYSVFIYDHNTPMTKHDEEEEEEEDQEEEEEEEAEDDEESSTVFKGRITPSGNLDFWQPGYVTGISKLPGKEFIRCNLTVQTACNLSDPKQVGHLMKLDFLKLDLPNSANDKKHRGHFVHRIMIDVTPTEHWRTKINHIYAMPSDDSQPMKEYANQEGRSIGAALTLTAPWSAGIQGTYGTSSGLTSVSTGEFKWASAKVDDSPERPRWSVTWTWNLLRWDDGQSFDPNKPGKVKGWSLPKVKGLPTLSLAAVEHNWAEWSTSSGLEGMEKMEWDVEVKFHTVSLKRHVIRSGKEWVQLMSPEQIAPIKGKISGAAISSVSFPRERGAL